MTTARGMDFPANPAVGDVHTYTDDTGRKINFQWDGISWNRMDDPSASPDRGRDKKPPPPPVAQ
jgi:hypothetical protein